MRSVLKLVRLRPASSYSTYVIAVKPGQVLYSTDRRVAQDFLGEELSEHAANVIGQRNKELRDQHQSFRTDYPDSAQPKDGQKIEPNLAHRKKLIYRSKQRGWLEVDLLLGSWATDNVMSLNEDELKQYEDILNQETLDIYNMITKQMEVPKELGGSIMERLQEFALSSPIGAADPKKYLEAKAKMSN